MLVLDPAQVGQAVASIGSCGNLEQVQKDPQTSVSTLVRVLVAAHCLGEVPKKKAVDPRWVDSTIHGMTHQSPLINR